MTISWVIYLIIKQTWRRLEKKTMKTVRCGWKIQKKLSGPWVKIILSNYKNNTLFISKCKIRLVFKLIWLLGVMLFMWYNLAPFLVFFKYLKCNQLIFCSERNTKMYKPKTLFAPNHTPLLTWVWMLDESWIIRFDKLKLLGSCCKATKLNLC